MLSFNSEVCSTSFKDATILSGVILVIQLHQNNYVPFPLTSYQLTSLSHWFIVLYPQSLGLLRQDFWTFLCFNLGHGIRMPQVYVTMDNIEK